MASGENLVKLLNLYGLESNYPGKLTVSQFRTVTALLMEKPSEKCEVARAADYFLYRTLIMNRQSCSLRIPRASEEPASGGPRRTRPNSVHHPIDLALAVLLCCNQKLRGLLFQKLTTTLRAVPFLFPSCDGQMVEFPFSALKVLRHTFREGNRVVEHSLDSSRKFHFVSCLRLGKLGESKSELLNRLIGVDHVFHSKNDVGGREQREFAHGYVELAWTHAKSEAEGGGGDDDWLAVLNLRGDALQSPQQAHFLLTISSVVVLFVDGGRFPAEQASSFVQFVKSHKKRVILLEVDDRLTDFDHQWPTIEVQSMPREDLLLSLRKKIQRQVKKGAAVTLSEVKFIAQKYAFTEFEENTDVSSPAQKVVKLFSKSVALKNETIEKICQLERKMARAAATRTKTSEQVWSEYNDQMTHLRRQQRKLYMKPPFSDIVKLMIQSSSDETALVRFNDHLAEQMNVVKFWRQMAQVYECLGFSERLPEADDERRLPSLAARLLMAGETVELMDGDAVHVPTIWIKAVFQELSSQLGNRRILVLSVLGLQSSGKSTLLNTMFGIAFKVGAGRVTNGVFMSLLPVDQTSVKLGFDYVLLLDVEGLRSPEKHCVGGKRHDNELATFVFGVADVTLVNVQGETPGDMQDILEVCTYALLRMKDVDLHPSCFFVFQNVTETTAHQANAQGRLRIKRHLDEVTQTVCKEEGLAAKSFAEMYNFDFDEDVVYLPNLYSGTPPVAPISAVYSQDVHQLKRRVLTKRRQGALKSLATVAIRIEDIWKAVLHEKFAFSFVNSLEIMLYIELEEKYAQQWARSLRSLALQLQSEAENKVVNGEELASVCASVNDRLKEELQQNLILMNAYFEGHVNMEIMSKWRGSTKIGLEELKKALLEAVEENLKEAQIATKIAASLEEERQLHENKILKSASALARKLKEEDRCAADKLTEEFEKLWSDIMSPHLASSQRRPARKNVRALAELALQSCRPHDVQRGVLVGAAPEHFIFSKQDHLKLKLSNFKNLMQWNSKLSEAIEAKIATKLAKLQDACFCVNEYKIIEFINACSQAVRADYPAMKFTKKFHSDLIHYIVHKSIAQFEQIDARFEKKHSISSLLERKKGALCKLFVLQLENATALNLFSEAFLTSLKDPLAKQLRTSLVHHITERMNGEVEAFRSNRTHLENHILKWLAERNSYQLFTAYLDHPQDIFQQYIAAQVGVFLDNLPSGLTGVIEAEAKKLFGFISTEILGLSSDEPLDTQEWLALFRDALKENLQMPDSLFTHLKNERIRELAIFHRDLLSLLEKHRVEIVQTCEERQVIEKEVAEILSGRLEGCWELCPFCRAVCTCTIKNHREDHSLRFHRIQGLMRWRCIQSDKIVTRFCSDSVKKENTSFRHDDKFIPYTKYRTAGPPYDRWNITPEESPRIYWRWFIVAFQQELEQDFGRKFEQFPDNWRKITREYAIQSLFN